MTKPLLVILAALLLTIAAARFAFHLNSDAGDGPDDAAWAQNRMEFTAWNDEKWTAWINDGAFEQTPHNSRKWSRHSNASIAFTNWQGEAWQAKIDGNEFLLAFQGNWQGPVERAEAIRYRDWSGKHQIRTIRDLQR